MSTRPSLVFIVADDLEPEPLQRMRDGREAWDATMPPIPDDATVSLGYSVKDMPQC